MTRGRRPGRLAPGVAAVAVVCGALAVAAPRPTAAVSLLAVPDTRTIVHDRTTTVPAPGVLANDVVLLGTTTAVLDSGPSHGSVSLSSNGGYTYDPDPGYVGTDVFRYHNHDVILLVPTNSNSTTVTITITNRAPVAEDDRESANAGRKETVDAPGVLENDDDPDNDPLQAKLVSGPAHGVLSLRADGGFDYTADPGFDGDDVFTYRATDGIADSAVTQVVMNVSASGSTPKPSVAPTPTPTPTPRPTPSPTLPPIPVPTLPPIPLPTGPVSVNPTPAPTAGGTPPPGASARPSPPPTSDPGASPSPLLAPGRPDASVDPGSGAVVPGGPGDPGGGTGGGRPGDGGSAGSGGAGSGATGSGSAGSGGAGSDGSSPGGGSDADGPVFSIGGDGPDPVVPLIGAEFAGFDSIDWAVPALTLTVPGLLVMLAVLAQLSAGAVWLPVARRWLGAFGLVRRRRRSAAG